MYKIKNDIKDIFINNNLFGIKKHKGLIINTIKIIDLITINLLKTFFVGLLISPLNSKDGSIGLNMELTKFKSPTG